MAIYIVINDSNSLLIVQMGTETLTVKLKLIEVEINEIIMSLSHKTKVFQNDFHSFVIILVLDRRERLSLERINQKVSNGMHVN